MLDRLNPLLSEFLIAGIRAAINAVGWLGKEVPSLLVCKKSAKLWKQLLGQYDALFSGKDIWSLWIQDFDDNAEFV